MNVHRRIGLVVAGALGLILSLSSCTSAGAEGTISGRLLAVGGPSDIPNRPMPGTVTVTNTNTQRQQSVSVGADGQYSVSVAAGGYTLTGASPLFGDGTYTCRSEQPVRVTAATASSVDVICLMP